MRNGIPLIASCAVLITNQVLNVIAAILVDSFCANWIRSAVTIAGAKVTFGEMGSCFSHARVYYMILVIKCCYYLEDVACFFFNDARIELHCGMKLLRLDFDVDG